jgi:hypothetical protein
MSLLSFSTQQRVNEEGSRVTVRRASGVAKAVRLCGLRTSLTTTRKFFLSKAFSAWEPSARGRPWQ